MDQQFRLKWNNHCNTLLQVFGNLLKTETLVDCTIGADGQYLKAHKVVVSACSPYFQVRTCKNSMHGMVYEYELSLRRKLWEVE